VNRIYLDLETTGLGAENSIIEISARYYRGSEQITSFSGSGFAKESIVNLEALRVNKYTFANLDAVNSEEALLKSFFDWLVPIEGSPDLAGVNIQFDYNLLKARAEKYKIVVGSVLPYRLHDITNISRFLTKIGLLNIKNSGKGNSLKDLATTLGVTFDEEDLHSADGDTALYYPVDVALENLVKKALCGCKV
jgi:DNA polymerase III epsilon subunit-like protein